MHLVLAAITLLFGLISPLTYIVSILKGRTRPHRTTRLVLAGVQLLNFVSIVAAHGSVATTLLAGIFAVQGLIIGVLSVGHGMGGSSIFDWTCLVIAAIGVIAWQMSGNALAGVWLSVIADAAACAPAVYKTWRFPHTETHWLYSTSLVATIASLLAAPLGATAIFQGYIIAIDVVFIFCIHYPH